jgi:hypothetical protein
MSTLFTRVGATLAAVALATAAVAAPSASAEATTVPACGNAALAITHTPTQGATGHGSFDLLYRNVSHATCSIYGYPGLDDLNKYGQVLAHAQRTLHGFAGGVTSETTATVAPGQFASAIVEWMNFNPVTSGSCAFSTSVATTPANTTHTVRFAIAVSVCDLQVHPTVAGTSGNNAFAAAQTQWIAGAGATSADQGIYWTRVETDLKTAGAAFSSQIALLKQLIALPDANQSAAQNATYHHDIAALNSFFGTAGLY